MEAPTISTKTDLTLDEAKEEYRQLTGLLNNPPEHGWLRYFETVISDRMSYLEKTITNYVVFKEQKNE